MNIHSLIPFSQFRDEVHTWAENIHDDFTQTSQITFKGNGDMGEVEFPAEGLGALFGSAAAPSNGTIGGRAFTQLCQRFHVPGDWAKNKTNCPDPLLEMVMNWKLQNDPDARVMVRQRQDGEENIVRAVLSENYVRFDHQEIIDAVYSLMQENGIQARVFRPVIDDTLRAYILVGDGYFGGGPDTKDGGLRPAVHIENDETGGGTVRIEGALWRQACSNGAIAYHQDGEKFRIFHRWNTKTMVRTLVNEALAVSFKLSQEAAVRFLEKQNEMVPLTSLAGIIQSWSSQFYLGDTFQKEWLGASQADANVSGTVSMWDVINNATALARGIESSDVQTQAERMAGQMIFA